MTDLIRLKRLTASYSLIILVSISHAGFSETELPGGTPVKICNELAQAITVSILRYDQKEETWILDGGPREISAVFDEAPVCIEQIIGAVRNVDANHRYREVYRGEIYYYAEKKDCTEGTEANGGCGIKSGTRDFYVDGSDGEVRRYKNKLIFPSIRGNTITITERDFMVLPAAELIMPKVVEVENEEAAENHTSEDDNGRESDESGEGMSGDESGEGMSGDESGEGMSGDESGEDESGSGDENSSKDPVLWEGTEEIYLKVPRFVTEKTESKTGNAENTKIKYSYFSLGDKASIGNWDDRKAQISRNIGVSEKINFTEVSPDVGVNIKKNEQKFPYVGQTKKDVQLYVVLDDEDPKYYLWFHRNLEHQHTLYEVKCLGILDFMNLNVHDAEENDPRGMPFFDEVLELDCPRSVQPLKLYDLCRRQSIYNSDIDHTIESVMTYWEKRHGNGNYEDSDERCLVISQNLRNDFEKFDHDGVEGALTDIRPLVCMPELKELHLNYNDITDVTSLENNLELEYLYLSGNNIRNVISLAKIKTLKYLDVSFNDIQDDTQIEAIRENNKEDLNIEF